MERGTSTRKLSCRSGGRGVGPFWLVISFDEEYLSHCTSNVGGLKTLGTLTNSLKNQYWCESSYPPKRF